MRLLTGYLMRTILTGTALVMVVLLALAALFEFIGQLDNTEGDFGTAQALMYSLLRLPQLSFQMFPIATLIGSLLGLGGLASNSELVVMRTAGVSMSRLASMVAVSGLAIAAATALIGEFIGPPLDYYARTMRTELRFGEENANFGNDAWVKDGPVILHLQRVNSQFDFGNIYLFRFNEAGDIESIGRAENSGIDESDNWILENLSETRFAGDRVEVAESTRSVETFDVDSSLLGFTLVKPISLSARGLLSYIDYLRRNELSAIRYETELWSRISMTTTVVLMPVLALAFVFGSLRSAGAGSRLMIGVLVGLAYFLASEMLANSGEVYNLNPAILTWIPSLVLVSVAWFALHRIR
ncbi:MAG: LPS export ABC transporter permease LptG [Gammaproteobacteria bacterium]|nr:LPS export ABC transporter permease LptG [Gammaproteobacteria bacterium]